jgi:PEGA domain
MSDRMHASGATRWLALLLLLAAVLASRPGRAQTQAAPPAGEASSDVERARTLYLDGLRLVREAQWGEALAAFEASQALRPHPMTVYNLGACERALGRYTRARERFLAALREDKAGELPPSMALDASGLVGEIERLLVHLTLQFVPVGAGLSVDGRPLFRADRTAVGRPELLAGILAPGPGNPAPAGEFEVILDPGAHVLTLSRKGYANAVVNRSFRPGERASLRLELERLPATMRISANEAGALVAVDGRDVGPVPIDVLRPAGLYRVEVAKRDFVPYSADVRVNAGEEATLRAKLVRERTPITKRWWFWTGAVAVVAVVAAVTFAATRDEPAPQRPPLDGGNLNWVAPIP